MKGKKEGREQGARKHTKEGKILGSDESSKEVM